MAKWVRQCLHTVLSCRFELAVYLNHDTIGLRILRNFSPSKSEKGYETSFQTNKHTQWCSSSVRCTAAAFACAACVSAWLLMLAADVCVCVAEFSTCLHWATHTLATPTPLIFFVSLFLWFMSVLLTGFHCKSNIKMFRWILCYLKPALPFSRIFHRKELRNLRAKPFISDIAI